MYFVNLGDSFLESILSFHYVDPGHQTQVPLFQLKKNFFLNLGSHFFGLSKIAVFVGVGMIVTLGPCLLFCFAKIK